MQEAPKNGRQSAVKIAPAEPPEQIPKQLRCVQSGTEDNLNRAPRPVLELFCKLIETAWHSSSILVVAAAVTTVLVSRCTIGDSIP
jgi:hypothetical protein